VLFVMLPVEAAAIWSLLAGYLLLPSATSYDAHLLPSLDRSTIPAISAFVLCWTKGTQLKAPKASALIYLLALSFIISPIFTSLNNSYELHIADKSIPGFYPVDALKLALSNAITLTPFFIGRRFLSSDRGRALLLKSLAIAGVCYSVPMLFEVRLSPQLHTWVYGFFPHSFALTARDGGFRPVVFLSNGLEVALFASIAVIAAAIAARARWQLLRLPAGAVATYLAVVLLLCKTLGAILYSAIAVPLVFFTTPKTWVTVSCAILLVICAYPMLRTHDLIPVEHIATAANSVSADRSGSFQFRVDNEKILLAKANQKPFFGWGTWSRYRVFDQETGKDVSITDGEWIIRFGGFGWLGYLSLFGLLATAVMQARTAVSGPVTPPKIVLGGLSLILAVNVIDMLPNANLRPYTFLVAGAVAGSLRAKSKSGQKLAPPVEGSLANAAVP
jgi:hypothetical protein